MRHLRWTPWIVLVLIVPLIGPAGCGGGSGPAAPQQMKDEGLVPLALLDHQLLRRAYQHLEDMRGSEMAPTWDQVVFAPTARKLYRPDVEGVAYYEIPVVPVDEAVGPSCGHVILSTGPHDLPIPHWNFEGLSICDQLAQQAEQRQEHAVRFFKLDALSYAAENEAGEQVATVGTPLARVAGMDPAWLDQKLVPHVVEWTPDLATKDDAEASAIDGTESLTGPVPPPELILTGWESWAELKAGYKDAYGVLAEDLKRLAAPDWQIEADVEAFGEGLKKGDVFRLSLMQEKVPPYEVKGDGAGANALMVTLQQQAGLPSVLVLTVLGSIPQMTLEFTVTIQFDGLTEIRKFGIVGPAMDQVKPGAPDGPPEVNGGTSDGPPQLGWGPFNYFFAGTDAHQRLYEQMEAGELPNTAGCYSGCGGTAWAMLFGWADNQADLGNASWAPRWGLYRENGGTGVNRVAPRLQDSGVRNMTWEIRNHLGTFCAFGSGPTFPWDMGRAARYFRNRTGTRLESRCNTLGIHKDDLRDSARDSIIFQGTPAVIGTGWLNHYPLAYGYAFRVRTTRNCNVFHCWRETEVYRWFLVNQGWGGTGNGWVGSGTFLYGSIRP